MVLAFLTELGYGFLRLFMNPVFYMAFILSFVLAFRRIHKERLHFHTRVYDVVTNLYQMLIPGLIAGFILYGLFIGLGLMLSEGIIVLLMAVTMLFGLTLRPRFLSPAFVIFFTTVMIVFMPKWEVKNYAVLNRWMEGIQVAFLPYLFLLMTIFLIVEAMLIMFQAKRSSSPRRVIGKRGKPIGGFATESLWLVPTFLLIPGSGLERLEWWPFFGMGESFAFIFVPFLIGYEQFQTYDLPVRALRRDGKRLAVIAFVALPLAVFALLYDWLVIAFLGMALLSFCRVALYVHERKQNERRPAFYTLHNQGVQILAIVPKSPAADMNVKVGEVIRRVNGIEVNNAIQFYEALQTSPTFFKLDVLDEHGELRFEQRALYENEHHALGLLFVDKPRAKYSGAEEA